jgi:hypothetical protein
MLINEGNTVHGAHKRTIGSTENAHEPAVSLGVKGV